MNVLVAVASKHGSTSEIGAAIVTELRAGGVNAALAPVEGIATLDGYDAVVLGSGVYAGHWLRGARDFVDRFGSGLSERPIWLFSSGPIGDPPKPLEDAAEVASVSRHMSARGHRLFAGRIEGADLGLAERALVKLVRAPEGDYRPRSEIASWAASIAKALREPASVE